MSEDSNPILTSSVQEKVEKKSKNIWIAGNSSVKKVASYIVVTISDNEKSTFLTAVGPKSINQTIKALAVAQGYLNKDTPFFWSQVEHVKDDEKFKNMFQFSVVLTEKHFLNTEYSFSTVKATPNITTPQLAGSLCSYLVDGSAIKSNAIGQVSIFRMINALVISQKLLSSHNIEIFFVCRFSTFELSKGNFISGIIFSIYPKSSQTAF